MEPRDDRGQYGIALRSHLPGSGCCADPVAQHLGAERPQEEQVPPTGMFAEHLCWVLGLEGQDVAPAPRSPLQPSCRPLHPLLLPPLPRTGTAMLLPEDQGDAGVGFWWGAW